MSDYFEMVESLAHGHAARLESLLSAPALDTFGLRRVEQEARRAGCSPSNVTAAIAWAEKYGVQAGITRAHQLADRQRPYSHNTPPEAA